MNKKPTEGSLPVNVSSQEDQQKNAASSSSPITHSLRIVKPLVTTGDFDRVSPAVKRPCIEEPLAMKKIKLELSSCQEELGNQTRKVDILVNQCSRYKKLLKITKRTSARRNAGLIALRKKNYVLKKGINKKKLLEGKIKQALQTIGSAGTGFHELLETMAKNNDNNGRIRRTKVSEKLRTLSLTLFYHSSKGYRYMRNVCSNALPHPRTLLKYLSCIDGRPGFSKESFSILSRKFSTNNNVRVPCTLIFDEMSIAQKKDFNGTAIFGYVDHGGQLLDDPTILAKRALVFLLCPMNKSWKVPIAYFMVSTLNQRQLKDLIFKALCQCAQVGMDVHNLVFDGCPTNFALCASLGCNFTSDPPVTSFTHPTSNHVVNVMPDPVHMLKVVRNCFGQWPYLVDLDGGNISFEYIRKLYKLQKTGQLKVANKLRLAHIEFEKKPMKVSLATQLLSQSVSDGLTFCLEVMPEEFKGAEATIRFLKMFNNLFDVMNSKNPFDLIPFRRPLKQNNAEKVFEFLDQASTYIRGLWLPKLQSKGVSGDAGSVVLAKIIYSQRKTGFSGFLASIQSLKDLYARLVVAPETSMSYISMNKLCQDSIESLFGVIRGYGRGNNNPSALSFASAWRTLLVHNELRDVNNGNCTNLDDLPVLTSSCATVGTKQASCVFLRQINEDVNRDPDEIPDQITINIPLEAVCTEDDVISWPPELDFGDNSVQYVRNVVGYIAGFLIYKLSPKLRCNTCKETLKRQSKDIAGSSSSRLIEIKSRGSLCDPSDDVVQVCLNAEKIYRMNRFNKGKNFNVMEQANLVAYSFMAEEDVFENMQEHGEGETVLDNHKFVLVRLLAAKYMECRLYNECKDDKAEKEGNFRVSKNQMGRIAINRHT